ncbi:hypothetical protein TRAPUB_4367 [Trametes pubescens]|uniref:Uncharacterized protein n=1 Tax=Trametes pubescens TaxID=154538 RepID=A0A1M2VBA7_TRAPU|nr:hypothetical protein TRAPUB_4367 [Trametes pubescens]
MSHAKQEQEECSVEPEMGIDFEQSQLPDTQFKHPDFLMYAYNLAMDSDRPQDTQAGAVITALLDHSRLAARMACELSAQDTGDIPREGFERVRSDLGRSCAVLEGALCDAVDLCTPLPSSLSGSDNEEDSPIVRDSLALDLHRILLPQLQDSLLSRLPALLLEDLVGLLLPQLLDQLQQPLIEALAIPLHDAGLRRYGALGRYTRQTSSSHGLTAPYGPASAVSHTDKSEVRAHTSSSSTETPASPACMLTATSPAHTSSLHAETFAPCAKRFAPHAQTSAPCPEMPAPRPKTFAARPKTFAARAETFAARAETFAARAETSAAHTETSAAHPEMFGARAEMFAARAETSAPRTRAHTSTSHGAQALSSRALAHGAGGPSDDPMTCSSGFVWHGDFGAEGGRLGTLDGSVGGSAGGRAGKRRR